MTLSKTPPRWLTVATVAALSWAGLTLGGHGAQAAVPSAPTSFTSTVTSAASKAVAVSPSMSRGEYEKKVQKAINARRAAHDLRRLKMATCADGYANKWGKYLATNDKFYHQSMTKIIEGCDVYYAGETLGRGAITPKYLVKLWMDSPTHKDVLLSKHPRRIGVGAYPNDSGEWVVAADFVKP